MLQLQGKACEISEKGIVATRLLVPSSKIGCIIGEGGRIITEMRRRTQADIRVYSKSDRPTCASADEELVQVMWLASFLYHIVMYNAIMRVLINFKNIHLFGTEVALHFQKTLIWWVSS